ARLGDRLYISKSLPHFLEFADKGVTKASGLEFLARYLGFTAEQTVAFGDGENDRELLEWAGYSVAVAHAHADLLTSADLVRPPRPSWRPPTRRARRRSPGSPTLPTPTCRTATARRTRASSAAGASRRRSKRPRSTRRWAASTWSGRRGSPARASGT